MVSYIYFQVLYPLAENYPGVVLIHSSAWGNSALKLFPFGDKTDNADKECKEMINLLAAPQIGVCPASTEISTQIKLN